MIKYSKLSNRRGDFCPWSFQTKRKAFLLVWRNNRKWFIL